MAEVSELEQQFVKKLREEGLSEIDMRIIAFNENILASRLVGIMRRLVNEEAEKIAEKYKNRLTQQTLHETRLTKRELR